MSRWHWFGPLAISAFWQYFLTVMIFVLLIVFVFSPNRCKCLKFLIYNVLYLTIVCRGNKSCYVKLIMNATWNENLTYKCSLKVETEYQPILIVLNNYLKTSFLWKRSPIWHPWMQPNTPPNMDNPSRVKINSTPCSFSFSRSFFSSSNCIRLGNYYYGSGNSIVAQWSSIMAGLMLIATFNSIHHQRS